jgi:succinoglycan biosynthesis transport protein ExoP
MANLAKRYKPLHPKYIQAQGELAAAKARVSEAILKSAESVGTALAAARETERGLEKALAEQEQASLVLSKISIPYNVLLREVQSDQALYDSVLTRLKETDVTKGVEQDNIRVIEPARLPEVPVKPRKMLVVSGALVAGLIAGVALCFLLNMMDNTFKTVDQAELQLDLPAVSMVPLTPPRTAGNKGLMLLEEPNGQVAEAFRTLRTSLSLLGKQSERTVFLFTSAVPGEGKSFCSMNYAVSLAQQGLRTLLIDADLRLPTVGKTFFGAKSHLGVADVIAGSVELDQGVQETDIPNLHIMTAGHRAPNPSEMLSGSGFGDLVRAAKHQFDRIVIDSAPVNAVSDSLLLVKWAHTVCLVVHAGKTPRKAVLRACKKLTEASARPAGFILNRMPQHGGVGYYYHYHSAGEYGNVYGGAGKTGSGAKG